MFLLNILHIHVITCKLLFNCSKIRSTVRFTFDHTEWNCLLISVLFSTIRPSQQDIGLNGWELYTSFCQDVFSCGLLVKVDQTASIMTDHKTSTMSPVIEAIFHQCLPPLIASCSLQSAMNAFKRIFSASGTWLWSAVTVTSPCTVLQRPRHFNRWLSQQRQKSLSLHIRSLV